METMSEVNATACNKYGPNAGGISAELHKFLILFGVRLSFLVFATIEEVSKSLQTKDFTLQQALGSFILASVFYRRQRTEQAFTDLMTQLHVQTLKISTKEYLNE